MLQLLKQSSKFKDKHILLSAIQTAINSQLKWNKITHESKVAWAQPMWNSTSNKFICKVKELSFKIYKHNTFYSNGIS